MNKLIILQGTYLGKHAGPLGDKMMRGFLKVLGTQQRKPRSIFFLGEAVRLLTDEFDAVQFLTVLEEQGVEILACRAAVEDNNLESKLRVGKIASTGTLIDLISKHEVVTL